MGGPGRVDALRERVVGTGLAVAALFHLAGNHSIVEGTDRPAALVVVQAVVGSAAIAVLLAPTRRAPVLVLAGAVPLSAWAEAPAVGNHWVLAALVGLTYLSTVGSCVLRDRSAPDLAATLVPGLRLLLLCAYSFAAFAAFAKLNTGFLDPATSCAVFYQDQLVSSWGLGGLSVAGDPLLGRATAIGASAVELSVPVLLLVRRTRPYGVLLALAFHWSLAMDLGQHFWDFTSVLFVLFLLFLDDERLLDAARRARAVRRRAPGLLRGLLVVLGMVLVLVATAAGSLGEPLGLRTAGVLAGHLAWWVVGTGVLVTVAVTVLSHPRAQVSPARYRPTHLVVLLVPLLAVLNGLTPYLELKTGVGWNMYSNLRTVGGDTNHLLVPATWDLTGMQRDRVSVLSSSDPALMRADGYELVWSEFQEYAHLHPDEEVVYRRGGRTYAAATLADDPSTASPAPSQVSYRLQPFRRVDVSGAERCLDTFGPAR